MEYPTPPYPTDAAGPATGQSGSPRPAYPVATPVHGQAPMPPNAPAPMPAPAGQPAPAKHLPKGWGKLWAAFGLGVAAFLILGGIEAAGLIAGYAVDIDQNTLMAVAEVVAGTSALLFVLALGGKRIAHPSLQGMGEAWRAAAWLFVADGLFVVAEIVEVAMGIEPLELAADWPARMGILALLCFGVGLMEESTMRGLCLNGLLARMGRTRGGVYGAVIVSSLMFGLLHFDVFIDFGDPLQVAQNCMKVLQTGMCGFLFAAIMVKTRNIWAVASIHAANDFMLLAIANGLTDADVAADYVQTGNDGMAVLLLYCILCALYLPFLYVGKRLIDQASPWRGDFYHYHEASPAQPATPPAAYRPAPAPMQPAQPTAQAPQGAPIAQAVWPMPGAGPADDLAHKAYRGKHARIGAAQPQATPQATPQASTPTTPQGGTHG